MDFVLAVIVLGAVIFFGALISTGNERQRKALDGIREQAALWAIQDLRLKREKLSREVKVDDPLAWLNRVAASAYGEQLDLIVTGIFDNPPALVCATGDGRKVVFSPAAPDEIRRWMKGRRSKLLLNGIGHPLLTLSRRVEKQELSILNAGVFFDLEVPLAWKSLTGEDDGNEGCLWLYIL